MGVPNFRKVHTVTAELRDSLFNTSNLPAGLTVVYRRGQWIYCREHKGTHTWTDVKAATAFMSSAKWCEISHSDDG